MRSEFITSSARVGDFPALDMPEVAFAGRSNVGKSALLNALAGAKVARISRTPGRTQLINFFTVQGQGRPFSLADLPGYGYARAPKAVQRTWAPLIEGYLETRENLRSLLLLVDVRRGLSDDDRALFDWTHEALLDRSVAVLAVGTKIDKLPKSKQKPALWGIAEALDLPRSAVLGTSATTRQGIEALGERLEGILAV